MKQDEVIKKNLALLASVSLDANEDEVIKIMRSYGLKPASHIKQ